MKENDPNYTKWPMDLTNCYPGTQLFFFAKLSQMKGSQKLSGKMGEMFTLAQPNPSQIMIVNHTAKFDLNPPLLPQSA